MTPLTDEQFFQLLQSDLRTLLAGWAEPLRSQTRLFVDELFQQERPLRSVALLPRWLSDLIPTDPDLTYQLGAAQLYGAWYQLAYDYVVDGGRRPSNLLGGQLALTNMMTIYQQIGVMEEPIWSEFNRLIQLATEARAIEQSRRFTDIGHLSLDWIAPFTLDLVMNRMSPLLFGTIAQLYLAGITEEDDRFQDIVTALRAVYITHEISRQVNRWQEDLRLGRLTYVNARLLRECTSASGKSSPSELDLSQVTEYQLTEPAFWADIERTMTSLNRQALDAMIPYQESEIMVRFIMPAIQDQVDRWWHHRSRQVGLRSLFTPISIQ